MARGGDELAAGVEEALELGGHRVEGASEPRKLTRAACRSTDGQVSLSETIRRSTQLLERPGDRRGQDEGDGDRACGRGSGDGEDLHIGAHVEHHPARQEDGGEGQQNGEQPERGELRADRRQPSQRQRADQADRERREGDDDREVNHGTNL